MAGPRYELCQLCEEKTGRAGRADDSIFRELLSNWTMPNGARMLEGDELGPLCEDCATKLADDGLIDD